MGEKAFLKVFIFFLVYYAFCYCFIFGENKSNMKLKVFASGMLLYILHEVFVTVKEIKDEYDDNKVIPKCLNVYSNDKYNINFDSQGRRDILDTKYKYKGEYYEYKLRDFFIPASYQSYLPCGNSFQLYHVDNIGQVINKGARALHLNIFPNEIGAYDLTAEPVVRGENITKFYGESLKFEDCCYSILNNAWDKTNAPIILYLEFSQDSLSNKSLMDKCGDILFEVFSHEIYNNNPQILSDLNNVSIKDVLKKIIIVTNFKERRGIFNTISWPLPKKYNFSTTLENRYTDEKLEEIKEESKKELVMFIPNNTYSPYNIRDGKIDLVNLKNVGAGLNKDEKDNTDDNGGDGGDGDNDEVSDNILTGYGAQLVFMNYQLFDEGMINYINFFKYNSLVVKDVSLRKMPIIIKEDEEEVLDSAKKYSQQTVSGNDWAEIRL